MFVCSLGEFQNLVVLLEGAEPRVVHRTCGWEVRSHSRPISFRGLMVFIADGIHSSLTAVLVNQAGERIFCKVTVKGTPGKHGQVYWSP